jgi:phenylpyruvate tautomerase PptA (4-oxalocrotonate tautomerase family)
MPLLQLTTNQAVEDKIATCQQLSRQVATLLGKPESYVMVILHDSQSMTFAGSDEPTALLALKSLGLPETQTSEFSQQLCSITSELLKIQASRVYIEFSSPERHMWGWDNRTFG